MQLDAKDIIIAILLIVNIFSLFGLYKSVPAEFVRIMLSFLEQKAAQTPDTMDDKFVAEAKRIIEGLLAAQKPPTVNTINVSTPPETLTAALTSADITR